MSTGLGIAIAIVRAWTRVYTLGLDAALRDARRAEIESDLWEQVHEPEYSTRAIDVWGRLLLGIPDDVRWSLGQRSLPLLGRVVVVTTASVILISFWWMRTAGTPVDAPPAPGIPVVQWINREPMPPPPPPPPPLCDPTGRPTTSPCTRWPQR
jgi:hypothetical protein